jgi:DNA-directed RNA polymerase subunit RPC12/RpoP
MANFYCEYCGTSASSIQSLTGSSCLRHPNGIKNGKHKLYEGSEKSKYVCKYCGTDASSINSLVGSHCSRHPQGFKAGKHAPAL